MKPRRQTKEIDAGFALRELCMTPPEPLRCEVCNGSGDACAECSRKVKQDWIDQNG